MSRRPPTRRLAAIGAVALGLALASPAAAKQFSMRGSWIVRHGSIFWPFQIPVTAVTGMTWNATGTTAEGGPLKGIGYPNGPVVGSGVVTASGGATSIMLPQGLFHSFASGAVRFVGGMVQVTTMFEVVAPFEAATLQKGGGPGSFTWCPTNPACTAGQPLAGIGRGNTRVIYREGANRFGGTMQVALRNGGIRGLVYDSSPWQIHHSYFSAPEPLPVGAGAADLPVSAKVYHKAGVVTQPIAWTPPGLVTQPGGKLTTQGGITTLGATGPILRLKVGVTPNGMSFGAFSTEYGFPHTTGTVIAQQTDTYGGRDDFFTLMGYDRRGPNGAGNIATVAGGVAFQRGDPAAPARPYATIHKTWLQLRSPVPTLSPAGLAAAAALVLLAVGYALSRRR